MRIRIAPLALAIAFTFASAANAFTNERSLEDWRDWVLHVSDDQGDELFVVPFTFVLGKPH